MTSDKQLTKVTVPQPLIDYAKKMSLPYVTHRGTAIIGDARLKCAVLSNGERIFTEHSITVALLGTKTGLGIGAKERSAKQPRFLLNKSLQPFVPQGLCDRRFHRVAYAANVGTVKEDCSIDILVDACNIWLAARDAGALRDDELSRAYRAELLLRGLARTGVAAIVDEATGYQADREQEALQKLLSKYLSEELLQWTKEFPDSFYDEMFRLYGWEWKSTSKNKKPLLLGKITNILIYKLLPQGLLEKLQGKNPWDKEKGRRLHTHHQFLTEIVGKRMLASHISRITALAQASSTFDSFDELIHRLHPDCEPLPKPTLQKD